MRSSKPARVWATAALLLLVIAAFRFPPGATATPATFSGTVSYNGTYSGDTLFVAVLDTTGTEDVTILDLKAYPAGPPPIAQPYSLTFDNAGLTAPILVASFLDVDGGGVDSIGGLDVFGWYGEESGPAGVAPDSSQSGLNFALPRAEIHGTVTFATHQFDARVDASVDPSCAMEGFRPQVDVASSGTYSMIGLYAGTYCVNASGSTPGGQIEVCYGDPTCASPGPVTLGATEVRTGVDLDFSLLTPVDPVNWGRLKTLYR
jgi:hypothetical protein